VTVIGANGAGKSSLVNSIVGVVPKAGGRVEFAGDDITAAVPEELVGQGVVLVPERRELFPALAVEDNLRLGAYVGAWSGRKVVSEVLARVYATVTRRAERRTLLVGTMSGGELRRSAIGRAMMASPRLPLRDEPSLCLAALIVEEIFKVVAD